MLRHISISRQISNEALINAPRQTTENCLIKKTKVQIAIKNPESQKTEEDASLQSSEDIEDPQIDPVQTMEYLNQLNEGVGLYQSGKRADAMQRFLSLSMLPEVPNDIRQESIVYIFNFIYTG